jgi:DNA-binding response OmpR family regulator
MSLFIAFKTHCSPLISPLPTWIRISEAATLTYTLFICGQVKLIKGKWVASWLYRKPSISLLLIPFSIRQVLARVRAILRRVELDSQLSATTDAPAGEMSLELLPGTSPPLVRDSLHIYLNERSARLDGQELDLTPKEYDLLVLLASHPGWVFKREVLLQQIWGDNYDGFDRTIDNHVTRLRKKLGPMGEKIDTVWGVGYRFLL